MTKLRVTGPKIRSNKAEIFDVGDRYFVVVRPPPGSSAEDLDRLASSMESLSDLLGMPVVCLSDEESLEVVECEDTVLLETERRMSSSLARKCDELQGEVEALRARLAVG